MGKNSRQPAAFVGEFRRVVVVSDIHYAGPIEQGRRDHEARAVPNPLVRTLLRAYRRYVWLRNPQSHTYMLDRFLAAAPDADLAVALGDLSCDTAFVGAQDEGAFQSVKLCVEKLTDRFGAAKLRIALGDHDLGKKSLAGGVGGPHFASLERLRRELALPPFWTERLGPWRFVGVTSTLIALPVFLPELDPEERKQWEAARREHLEAIRRVFLDLAPEEQLFLCCHDPTALPFLWELSEARERARQLEATLIGHLHTPLVLRLSGLLAGMPQINFLGNTVRRLSSALRRARDWKPFRVRLCPSLTGIQLLKDGGFWEILLPPETSRRPIWRFHPLPW